MFLMQAFFFSSPVFVKSPFLMVPTETITQWLQLFLSQNEVCNNSILKHVPFLQTQSVFSYLYLHVYIFRGFPDMTTLKILHLCNMPELREIGEHSLSGLENLEELYINDNIGLTSLSHATLIRANVENPIWPRIKKVIPSIFTG